MLDMFGPDALAASASGAELELPCSDSELERELEACMAEMLGSTPSSKPVRFCLNPARPVRPLPARPVPAGAVPPPVIALEGRSFPLESSNGVFFDEQMYEAFRTASYPAFPPEESTGKDMTFDEIFGLGGDGMEEVMRAHAAGDQLQTIMEDPAETDLHGELEATTDPRAGLWDELFGDGEMEALGIQVEA
ncbi:hypothetical protein WOLCODRAFT_135808 [Wolfiporia cocos MD-104 SS10]|uniref:Uncharacterized protein n=1 Tax=Wolfiporia cocos (strain MD-104) TaxID=742152 RepID=A0A2H3JNY5_WOLCO|nr:hypothetical protein WOLCODRAFT_135808 [Wolfiporia cocos MD-104 SS10]